MNLCCCFYFLAIIPILFIIQKNLHSNDIRVKSSWTILVACSLNHGSRRRPGKFKALKLHQVFFWPFMLMSLIYWLFSIDQVTYNSIIEFDVWTDNPSKKSEKNKEEREKLGLAPAPKGRSAPGTPHPEPSNAYQKIDVCVFFFFSPLLIYEILVCEATFSFDILSHDITII